MEQQRDVQDSSATRADEERQKGFVARQIASFVVDNTMFPSREEEDEGKITRHIGYNSAHCMNFFRQDKLVVGTDSP